MAKYGTFLEYLNRDKQLTESSLSRLWRKYKEFDSGTISACRGDNTNKINDKRTLELKTELIRLGYSVTAVAGTYIENFKKPNAREVREKSFIVFDRLGNGTLKADLIRLGKKYDQDSITYSDVAGNYYLIGTNSTGYPGMGVEVKLGRPMFGKTGEFFSRVNGRPFVFEEMVQGYYNFDCSPENYNRSTHMMLAKVEDFVLSE